MWRSDLIVNKEFGAFEVSRRHSDVVLLRRVIELCQTPVDEAQLRKTVGSQSASQFRQSSTEHKHSHGEPSTPGRATAEHIWTHTVP